MTTPELRPIIPLDSPDLEISLVGGKGINLAKMISNGFSVPPALSVTVDAYEMFLDLTGIRKKISDILDSTKFDDEESLEASSQVIRRLFFETPIPE